MYATHRNSIVTGPTGLTRAATSWLGLALLAGGPAATVALLEAFPPKGWDRPLLAVATLVVIAAWSPFTPMGVPALLLQDERDLVTERRGLSRVPALARHLGWAGPKRVVLATWLNILGLVVALVLR